MRPAIQPLIVYLIYKALSFVGTTDPFIITFITRLLAAIVSYVSILMILKAYMRTLSDKKLQYAFMLLSFMLWFSVYNSVRFSSETMSGRIFLIGLACLLLKQVPGTRDFFLTGILLGLSFVIRYQVAFMILGFGLWLLIINKAGARNFLIFILGICLMIAIGVLSDRWYYGEWVNTAWNYFRYNLLLGKASGFGTSPWYFYFEHTFLNTIPPFSLVYILACLIYSFYFPKDCITWTIVPFILVHFIIPHKELRFMFPFIGLLPVMIIRSGEILLKKRDPDFLNRKYFRILIKTFWYTNLVMMLILVFRPADQEISLYKKIYYTYKTPVKLYYTDENPFRRASVDLNFYKRNNLSFIKIDSPEELEADPDTISLLVTCKPGIPTFDRFNPVLIYSSIPAWLKHFNINHWVERTSFYYVYELRSYNNLHFNNAQ